MPLAAALTNAVLSAEVRLLSLSCFLFLHSAPHNLTIIKEKEAVH